MWCKLWTVPNALMYILMWRCTFLMCVFMSSFACTLMCVCLRLHVLLICLCVHACSQVICLSVKGHGVQVHVDVWVVLAADPADGRAVEWGAWADVCLQGVQRIRVLVVNVEIWEFKGQHLGCLVEAAERQRSSGEKRLRNRRHTAFNTIFYK